MRLEDKRFYPEDVGEVVIDKLVEHFPEIVDVNFTAKMEEELDHIAEGEIGVAQVLREFYGPFERALEKAEEKFERYVEEVDEDCPRCPEEGREPGRCRSSSGGTGGSSGARTTRSAATSATWTAGAPRARAARRDLPRVRPPARRRVGRYGPFVGCSGYPECRYIKKEPPKSTGVTCPQCDQGEIVEKRTRFGLLRLRAATPSATSRSSNPPDPGPPVPRVRLAAAPAAEERPVLELRRRARPGVRRDEARRRRGRGRGPRREGRGAGRARRGEGRRRPKKTAARRRPPTKRREGKTAAKSATAAPRRPRDRRARGLAVSTIADEVAALRGTRPATFKDLLTHPAFSRLLAALTVSSLGDWVGFVAVTSLVASLSGRHRRPALAVAGVMVARMLPAILFGPIAGALVDRFDRKQIMIAADVARGALYATMPFLGTPLGHLPALVRDRVLLAAVDARPRRDAAEPRAAPAARERELARARDHVRDAAARRRGLRVSLAGARPRSRPRRAPEALALAARRGHVRVLGVHAEPASAAAPAARRLERLDLSRVWRDIVDGLRFLREDSIASAMTAGIVVAFTAVGAVLALGPIFAKTHARTRTAGWGVLVTAFGVGMAIGMAGSNKVDKFVERELVFVWSLIAAAGALFVLAAMPNIPLAAVVTVWLGLFCGLAWVSGYMLLQENVEDEFRGRTFASLTVLSRLGLFLSLAAVPGPGGCRWRRGVPSATSGSTCPGRASRSGRPGSLVARAPVSSRAGSSAVPAQPAAAPRARAEAEAPAGERALHRLRGRRGRRQGHADPPGGGVPRGRRASTCSSRASPAGPSSARSSARCCWTRDRQGRRAGRGAAVRRRAARST